MPANLRQSRGFSLIEVMVTVAIVATLATLVLPLGQLAVQRSKEQELRSALRQMRQAIDAYKQAYDEGRIQKSLDSNGYPATLQVLVDGVEDVRHPQKQKLYFLRRIPRDPMISDTSIPADRGWGLRSYKSTADEPREGEDVYDVYSTASGKGLNGVPYRDW